MNGTTGVAFDLDGCLVSSRGAILPSIRVALVSEGLPALPDEAIEHLIGPPIGSGFAALLAGMGEDPARAGALVEAYRVDYRANMLDRTTLFDGIDGAVRRVAEVRSVCVVTSKPAEFAAPILDHLGMGDVFAFVAGPALDAPTETKSVTLARAMARLDLAVMVGDRHHDIDAGRAHGLATVGVTWGVGGADELAGADHLVGSPHELVAVLRGDHDHDHAAGAPA